MKTSVASNMKGQFKSYSDAVAENVMVCSTEFLADPTTLKNFVKSVVQLQEEDQSRNVIIFGSPEKKNENLEGRVQEI